MPEIIINYLTSLYDSFCVQWLIYWLGITEMIKTLIVSLMDLCSILIFEIMISSFMNFYSIVVSWEFKELRRTITFKVCKNIVFFARTISGSLSSTKWSTNSMIHDQKKRISIVSSIIGISRSIVYWYCLTLFMRETIYSCQW